MHNATSKMSNLLCLLNFRLGVTDVADVPCNLALHDNSTSKRKLPAHVPSSFSLRQLLLHHIEIRAVPKKVSAAACLNMVLYQEKYFILLDYIFM